jgi:hypothetical protein
MPNWVWVLVIWLAASVPLSLGLGQLLHRGYRDE